MKRKFVWMMLFALVLGGLLLAEEGATFKVKVATANVRSKPDSSAPVIAKVTTGTVLKVYGKEGVWYEVGVKDKTGEEAYGFIHSTMGVVSGEEAEATPEPEPTEKIVKTEKAEEKPEEKPVEKAVVTATQEVSKARSAQPAKEIMVIKVKVQMANVRTEPDAASALVARVPAGTLLGVTSHAGNWYEVNMNDQSGKAVSGFIRDTVVSVVGADGEEEAEEEKEYVPSRPASNRSYSRPGADSSTAMHFGLNFGAQTDTNFNFDPFLWTTGVELDIEFGSFLMLSPEAILVGSGFEFKNFILYPAAILNLTASSFFVGGGVAKGFFIGSGTSGSTDFLLKLNAGLVAPGIKLTAYALMAFDDLFGDMILGATLGFRF
jgi:uncharacterized protein YgiM (DUF1202 family)